ncbi:MAG: hypothetical protein IJJ06_05415 [Mogibacterium sp.]|nr:hypothetical protein [Mogibacterium sp.]
MKIGISACSNGLSAEYEKENYELMNVLSTFGIEAVSASHIYACRDEFSGTDEERAGAFDQATGVLLGTFTMYEKSDLEMSVYDLLKMHIGEDLPAAATREIGYEVVVSRL